MACVCCNCTTTNPHVCFTHPGVAMLPCICAAVVVPQFIFCLLGTVSLALKKPPGTPSHLLAVSSFLCSHSLSNSSEIPQVHLWNWPSQLFQP